MIELSRCACGGIAHIFAEESQYNNRYTPWGARCECLKCNFTVEYVKEYVLRSEAVNEVANKWNNHPSVSRCNKLESALIKIKHSGNDHAADIAREALK